MITISICDDHQMMRDGLQLLLSQHAAFKVIASLESGEALFRSLKMNQPSLLILDLSLEGRGGLEVLFQVKRSYPKIIVLILSMYPEEQFAKRAIDAGAAAYLSKDSAPEVLFETIHHIVSVKKDTTQKFADKCDSQKFSAHDLLSDREYEVFLRLGQGRSLTHIADRLCLSVKTVATYKKRIMDKLALQSNADIVKYQIRNGLIQPI